MCIRLGFPGSNAAVLADPWALRGLRLELQRWSPDLPRAANERLLPRAALASLRSPRHHGTTRHVEHDGDGRLPRENGRRLALAAFPDLVRASTGMIRRRAFRRLP